MPRLRTIGAEPEDLLQGEASSGATHNARRCLGSLYTVVGIPFADKP